MPSLTPVAFLALSFEFLSVQGLRRGAIRRNLAASSVCGTQWENMVCSGFGCFSCGARVVWLSDLHNMTWDVAGRQVGCEFPIECGSCGSLLWPPAASSMPLQEWQQWPLSWEGGAHVGGSGGDEFQINNYDSIVKTLLVWFGDGMPGSFITSIQVTYEDGHSVRKGLPQGSPWHFTFRAGEWIVGDLRLSSSCHAGGRLGSIGFTTNFNRTWDAGAPSRQYFFPTGGTAVRAVHMAGLSGSAGGEIDRLGVIFWKPIRGSSFLHIEYPTLSELARLNSPTYVRSRVYCNNGSDPYPAEEQKFEEAVTIGSETCLDLSLQIQFTIGATISAGIPFLKEFEGSAEWSLTGAVGVKNCQTQENFRKESLTFPSFDIPPRTRVWKTFSQWAGQIANLPYTATLRVTMIDGTTYDRHIEGFYRGVRYNDAHLSYLEDSDVTECQPWEIPERRSPVGQR